MLLPEELEEVVPPEELEGNAAGAYWALLSFNKKETVDQEALCSKASPILSRGLMALMAARSGSGVAYGRWGRSFRSSQVHASSVNSANAMHCASPSHASS